MYSIHRIGSGGSPARPGGLWVPAGVLLAATSLGPAGEMELMDGHLAWKRASRIAGPVPRPGYVAGIRDIIARSLGVIVPGRGEMLRLGDVAERTGGRVPVLHSVTPRALAGMDPERLAEMLDGLGTGLLVLEGAPERMDALAEALVRAGGPATLRVQARAAPLSAGRYFRKLYASLAEGQPLAQAARPTRRSEGEGLVATLFLAGTGPVIPSLPAGVQRSVVVARPTVLHAPPPEPDTAATGPAQGAAGGGAMERIERRAPEEMDFGAEAERGTGALADDEKPAPEDEGLGVEELGLDDDPDEREEGGGGGYEPAAPQPARAPAAAARVLNANFAEPGAGEVLEPHRALAAGREYELRVDVGPQWEGGQSLVRGKKTFPGEHLPPVADGWTIQVVLVSDHFTPATACGEIFLPVRGGRSSPVAGGVRGAPGPLALRVTAPAAVDGGEDAGAGGEALGRLLLYYGSNLVQSALVRAGVRATPGESLERENRIDVDYVLSATLGDLGAFATRRVSVDGRDGEVPVGLSLALNGDGAGGHRIILKGDPAAVPAWVPFDPRQAARGLEGVRARLKECFFHRDPASYAVDEARPGLDGRNGKSKQQFKMDLFRLAAEGSRLYEMVATSLRPTGVDARTWEWQFRHAAAGGVVQVARTGAANWVLPWAVMYEFPIVEPDPAKLTWCRVLDEWGDDGVRHGPLRTACPHAGDADHQQDVVCPYGFWGMSRRMEQPLGALASGDERDPPGVTDRVECGAEIDLVAAVTNELDDDSVTARDQHLQRLSKLPRVRYTAPPADDWPGVQKILAQPEVVYFLCHGEYDEATSDGYLGVGRRDADPRHRVYANTLSAWMRTQSPASWLARRPLVLVNGCHTFELEPGRLLNFVAAFAFAGASGVIGTEVSVQLPVAMEAADLLLGAMIGGPGPDGRAVDGLAADDALRAMRWALADKGNLLGLAYTMYALADLRLRVDA
jgi:hypothetical protein